MSGRSWSGHFASGLPDSGKEGYLSKKENGAVRTEAEVGR